MENQSFEEALNTINKNIKAMEKELNQLYESFRVI